MYNDFGFCMCKKDTYGTAMNEYAEAIEILKKHMTEEAFHKLVTLIGLYLLLRDTRYTPSASFLSCLQ